MKEIRRGRDFRQNKGSSIFSKKPHLANPSTGERPNETSEPKNNCRPKTTQMHFKKGPDSIPRRPPDLAASVLWF